MELNRTAILEKTHDGLHIYAHVLSECYPNDASVLSLSGRDCKPAKNPFNGGKPTLKIQIVNNCATHRDLENHIPDGDAFTFAEMYFKIEGEELLKKIDEVLLLGIRNPNDKPGYKAGTINPSLQTRGSGTAPVFSYFKGRISNTNPEKEINLIQVYNLIRGDDFANQTSILRGISDEKEARKYKATHFDYVTFSGTFFNRCDEALKIHSGLLTLDFDHLSNTADLNARLLEDEYFETELLFVSPSGNGLKWIIAIDLRKCTNALWFKAISAYIRTTYQLQVDKSGKDVSRACFLPFDPDVYINPKYLSK